MVHLSDSRVLDCELLPSLNSCKTILVDDLTIPPLRFWMPQFHRAMGIGVTFDVRQMYGHLATFAEEEPRSYEVFIQAKTLAEPCVYAVESFARVGMSFVWVGIGYTLQPGPGGQPPDWLVKVFNVHLIVPESVLIILCAGLLSFLFCRSRYGTVLRGFGNNLVAVERSGWSILKAYIAAYIIASLFSVIGGMAMTASAAGSDINATASYTLLTVAAVVSSSVRRDHDLGTGTVHFSDLATHTCFRRWGASW